MSLISDHVGSVMHLMDLMQNIPENDFELMLTNILKIVGKSFIMKLILRGLLSMNRNDAQSQLLSIIQCVTNVMESESETEVDEEIEDGESNSMIKIRSNKDIISIKNLPSDSLCKICTFLSFEQLMKFELCSRYLCMIARMPVSMAVVTADSKWFINYWKFMDENLPRKVSSVAKNDNDVEYQLNSIERKVSYFHRFKNVSSLALKVHRTSESPFYAEEYYPHSRRVRSKLPIIKTCAQSFERALELCNKHIFHQNINHLYFAMDLEYFAIEQTHDFIPYFENLESIEFAPDVPFNHMLLFLTHHQKMCSHQQNNMSIISKINSLTFKYLSFDHETKMDNATTMSSNSKKKFSNFDLLMMKIDFNQIWKWFEIIANFDPQSLNFELDEDFNNTEDPQLMQSRFSSLNVPFSKAFSNLQYLNYTFGSLTNRRFRRPFNQETNEGTEIITPFIIQLISGCCQNLIELRLENTNMHEFWIKSLSVKKSRNTFKNDCGSGNNLMSFPKLENLTLLLDRRQLCDLLSIIADNSPKLKHFCILSTKNIRNRSSIYSKIISGHSRDVKNIAVVNSILNFLNIHFSSFNQLSRIELKCDLPLSQLCLMFISALKNNKIRPQLFISLNITSEKYGVNFDTLEIPWCRSFFDFLTVLRHSATEKRLKLFLQFDSEYNEQNWIRFLSLMQYQRKVNNYRVIECSFKNSKSSWNSKKIIAIEMMHNSQTNVENKIEDENEAQVLELCWNELGTKHLYFLPANIKYSDEYSQHILIKNDIECFSQIVFDRCTEELRYVDEFTCVNYYVFNDGDKDEIIEVIECNSESHMNSFGSDINVFIDGFPKLGRSNKNQKIGRNFLPENCNESKNLYFRNNNKMDIDR